MPRYKTLFQKMFSSEILFYLFQEKWQTMPIDIWKIQIYSSIQLY